MYLSMLNAKNCTIARSIGPQVKKSNLQSLTSALASVRV